MTTGDIKEVDVGDAAYGGVTTYRARAVVLAIGSAYRELGLPNEKRLSGHGVSWCATCDGFFFRDQDIAVVGGGDSAVQEATFLTRFARSVTLIHRRDTLRASKIMVARAEADPKLTIRWNSTVLDILGQDPVTGLRLRDVTTAAEAALPVTGVFVAIGHDPRNELIKGVIDLDENGYVTVQPASTATNATGVFAAGDVRHRSIKRVAAAAGTGCAAALDAERLPAALSDALPEAGEPASASSGCGPPGRPSTGEKPLPHCP